MMNHNFKPDKYQRSYKKHDEKQLDPITPLAPYVVHCFSIFKSTSTFWITFKEEVDPETIQDKLREKFEENIMVYSNPSENGKTYICLVELITPRFYRDISRKIGAALSYLK